MTEPRKTESLWFLNSYATVLRSALDGGGPFVGEFRMRFGDSPPTHVHHDEDEIFHIIEGRMRIRVGDKETVGEAGDTLVAPKGVPHTFRIESPEARVINISSQGDFERLLRAVGRPAKTDGLPDFEAVTPKLGQRLAQVAAANRLNILGPPMTA